MKTPIEMLIDKNIDNFKCSICGKKIRDLIKEEAKTMIEELVKEYYEMSDIKTLIEKEITNMSRDKIIELLKGKFN